MDELRSKRYKDKIQHINDYLQDLPIKPKNELEKRGIFYSLQTSIEAIVDLIAMLVKDLGIQVKDDNFNITEIIKIRKVNPELGKKLSQANGLRNIIVHRYNAVDDQIILDSVQEVKNLIFNWVRIVEDILNEIG
ncbi:MAG: DUF86 domain-containing protein [Candidatus Lokiarchaeota archaeon]|nr:DUF86 domain-containing protein [Candidatus Lokiarchaeota archaeon]